MPRIAVIDHRNNAMRKDFSNLDHPDLSGAARTIEEAEIIINVGQDGVFVSKGVGKVALFSTKTEAQESLEHAQEHKLNRLGVDRSEHDRVASLDKAFEALGTDQTKKVEIMRGEHLR